MIPYQRRIRSYLECIDELREHFREHDGAAAGKGAALGPPGQFQIGIVPCQIAKHGFTEDQSGELGRDIEALR